MPRSKKGTQNKSGSILKRVDDNVVVRSRIIGDAGLEALSKGLTGRQVESPSGRTDTENRMSGIFMKASAIEPAIDPAKLLQMGEVSSTLRSCAKAYSVNIGGRGLRIEPFVDLKSETARDQIKAAMRYRRIFEAMENSDSDKVPDRAELMSINVEDEEVDTEIDALKFEADMQYFKLESFLDAAVSGQSISTLLRKTVLEKHIIGWAAWEALRDTEGRLARFSWLPGWTIRPLKKSTPVLVSEMERMGKVYTTERAVYRNFRGYVQVTPDGETIYFKEFRDPRVMSRQTGQYFKDMAAFKAAVKNHELKDDDIPANELKFFNVFWPRGGTGLPEWSGATAEVLGIREASEVNLAYFNNKAIPPMAIMVHGGRLSKDSVEDLKNQIEAQIKGKGNFHKILILEAQTPKGKQASGLMEPPTKQRPMIEMKSLMGDQLKDALFMDYIKLSENMIGRSMRIPPLARGGHEDFNKGTALAQLRFVEDQVFAPERSEWEEWFNNDVLEGALGITLWKVQIAGTISFDPETMAKIIKELSESGSIVTKEARQEAAKILGRTLAPIDERWTDYPLSMVLQGLTPIDNEESEDKETDGSEIERLVEEYRERWAAGEQKSTMRIGDTLIISLPQEDFDKLVEPR